MTSPEAPGRWHIAVEFGGNAAAVDAYERARDVVFSRNIHATVFRISLSDAMIVVAVGDRPAPSLDFEAVASALADGTPADLDIDTVHELHSRRAAVVVEGPGRIERRSMFYDESSTDA